MKLDDFIPCEPKNWWDKNANPLFSKSIGNEIYVNLIEKAFAKFAGSYSNLSGGSLLKAVIVMTGCENNIMWDIKDQIATCKY
jgi:calpain-15